MIARIQHLVRDILLLQQLRERFRLLDADRAAQDRLLPLAAFKDLLDDRVVFFTRRAVDLVVIIGADTRLIGRDFDDLEPIDVAEFLRLGHCRACHARELRVHAEVVLEGDRGQRLVLVLDRDAFLRFERLVQPFGVAAPLHHAAGEFIDDDDLVVLDDVIGVAGKQLVGAQRLVNVVDERHIMDVVERADA